jgi:hypothetical protein
MTNQELQDAILQTNVMIKNSTPGSEKERVLIDHFKALLENQRVRAHDEISNRMSRSIYT